MSRLQARGRWMAALALAATLAAGGGPAAAAGGVRPLELALTPQENPEKLETNGRVLARYLEGALGRPVVVRVADDYAAVVEALRTQTADVAFLPSLPYALARELGGARILVVEERRGRTYYYSRIFVRKGSGITTLEQLRGKTIAFTDPVSSSGFMFPVALLVKRGLIPDAAGLKGFFKEFFFAGGYEQAIRALVNGFVDAAAGSQYMPEIYLTPEEREQVVWIAEHGPVPNHGVAVRRDLPEEEVTRLRQALLALNEPAHRDLLRNLYGWEKIVPADPAAYDGLVEAARLVGVLERPRKASQR
ncbi:MAG TPA: phosphate/phosphite/phosphonate ABC transporter substrate-binding protein [Thermodesulfobacteriota bacterium]|nr:phosphate/phosphite/phosphonate ABC transporter substrate-binding protein [Thermodesulfobacteriota bacterium]